jgi:catechol 2,3-dioxygenase-like lactoylglutathione lyase family enzyme
VSLRIHHLALRTRDPARVERFYADVLGLRVARRDAARGGVWLDAGGTVLMIERAGDGEPAPCDGTQELIAFGIDANGRHPDLDAWRARLAAASVSVEAETPFTLYFRDPEGRRVALSTYVFDAARPADDDDA